MSAPLAPSSLRPSPLDLGGILANTFSVFRGGLGLFVILGLLPSLIAAVAFVTLTLLLLAGAIESATSQQVSVVMILALVAMVPLGFVLALVQARVSGMTALAADAIASGNRPTFSDVARDSRGLVGRVLGIYLLAALAGAVGVLILIAVIGGAAFMLYESQGSGMSEDGMASILGSIGLMLLLALVGAAVSLVLTVKFWYFIPSVAIERRTGMAALRRSWALTTGSFWRTAGAILVVSLLISAVSGAASGMTQMFTMGLGSLNDSSGMVDPAVLTATLLPVLILSAVVQVAIQTVATPLLTVLSTVMHRDQVQRKEGLPGPSAYGAGYPGSGYPGQPYPGQTPYSGQPTYPGQQPYPGQAPYPGSQTYPGQQPYPGQTPYPGQQPYPGQAPYPGQQPYPGQTPYPGQPGSAAPSWTPGAPTQPWPTGGTGDPGQGAPTQQPWQDPAQGSPWGDKPSNGPRPDDPTR